MILDRALRTAGDEYQRVGACGKRFIDRVLNQRLVHDGKHFLRTCLGDREESRAASGNGKNGGFYWLCHRQSITDLPQRRRRTFLTREKSVRANMLAS